MDPAKRTLTLVAELRKGLDTAEEQLKANTLSAESVTALESMLIERRWPPGFAGLTGPSGYDPKPVYIKCDKCSHYRLKD